MTRNLIDIVQATLPVGYTGSQGPSTAINATASTSNVAEYLVAVPSAGSNQTPVISSTTPIVYNPSTGRLGIGTASPGQKLTIEGDAGGANANWSLSQLQIQGSNTNQRLTVGYDTTNEQGVIQAGKNGTGWEPLLLNPAGGNVGVGNTGNPISALSVLGPDNTANAKIGLYRSSQDYGVELGTTGSTGHSTIASVGTGANLTISAAGTLSLSSPTVTGIMTGIGSQSVLTYLSGNSTLTTANTYYDIVNTGSIGANGQKWLIFANGSVQWSGGAIYAEFAIWNGSSYIAAQGNVGANANWPASGTPAALVTLTGATTFTLRAAANQNSTSILGTSSYGINNVTYIYAVRLS